MIGLFRDSGRFYRDAEEMFAVTSWVQVMLGQHIQPRRYHPMADQMPDAQLDELVDGVRKVIANCVDAMPRTSSSSRAIARRTRCRSTSPPARLCRRAPSLDRELSMHFAADPIRRLNAVVFRSAC